MRVANDAYNNIIFSVCSFMTLFNDLNLKIMKLALYGVQK